MSSDDMSDNVILRRWSAGGSRFPGAPAEPAPTGARPAAGYTGAVVRGTLSRRHAILALMVFGLLAVDARGLFCAVECLSRSLDGSSVSSQEAAHCGGAASSEHVALQATDGTCPGHAAPAVAATTPVRAHQLSTVVRLTPLLTICMVDAQLVRPAVVANDVDAPPGAPIPLRI